MTYEANLVLAGIIFGACMRLAVSLGAELWAKIKMEREYANHPRLVPFSEFRLCEETHQWRNLYLALRGLPVGGYKVCTECGCISGNSEQMVSDEVLKLTKERLAIEDAKAAAEKALQDRVNELAAAYVHQYIRRNFAEEVNDVHFAERLSELSAYSIRALTDAAAKVAAEMEAQKELDSKYDGWPAKVKGNA